MNVTIRGAVAAFAVMVAFASHASAQDTTATAPPPEAVPAPAVPSTPVPVVAGKGSVGGFIGVPIFLADEDTKNGQSPRVLGQFMFQYCFTPRTRLAMGAGYGWIGYKDDTPSPYGLIDPATGDSVFVMNDALTKFQPISATLLHSFNDQGRGWVPYAGAGVNVTRIEIVNDRQKIKDPATFDSYVNWSPGVQAQVGIERFMQKGNVSFEWNARFAHQFSKDEEQFPSGFTGPHTIFTINFGVNAFFWPVGYKPIEVAPEPVPEPATPAPSSTPAPADTTPAPVPPPVPPPPPDTAQVDTTRAPGSSQSSVLLRHKTPAPAPTAAAAESPAAKGVAPLLAPREERAICPAPPEEESTGMFGVPGVPVPPKAEDEPPPAERRPASAPTPMPAPEPEGSPSP